LRSLAGSCLLLLAPATALAAAPPRAIAVRTESLRIVFSPEGGEPESWTACHPSCDAPDRTIEFGGPEDPPAIRVVAAGDPELTRRLAALRYRAERHDGADGVLVAFASDRLTEGVVLEKRWWVAAGGYQVWLRVGLAGERASAFLRDHPLEVQLSAGSRFAPTVSHGLAALSERVTAVSLSEDGLRELDGEEGPREIACEAGSWGGLRNRFWALLLSSDAAGTLVAPTRDSIALRLAPGTPASLHFYSGPVERSELDATDPRLAQLLFPHLWFWMRWLALGLLRLLEGLYVLVGSWGIAVVLLAPAVRILMRPLTSLAERWQRDVNEKRSLLQPRIDEIKAAHSGSERSRRLLALHSQHGINPFFGLKSLFGVLIQIPLFFAAYHALDEAFLLSGARFLWIADLARPDRVATLPFELPLFGDELNVLPLLMTAVTLLSSRLHDDGTLAGDLLRKQRRGLYAMALAFLALFYTVPAGMVLYWTSNNLVALVQGGIVRRAASRRGEGWSYGALRH
jgi:YidC/Oxa1 family membrane protein insertase